MHTRGLVRSVVAIGAAVALVGVGGAASAASPTARMPLSGYVVEETGGNVGPGVEVAQEAVCPEGTVEIGGGGYTSIQGIQESLGGSWPVPEGQGWFAEFYNATQTQMGFTEVTICAALSSLVDYQDDVGKRATIPTSGTLLVTATCPSGLTALSGGWVLDRKLRNVQAVYSGPVGTTGWQVLVSGLSGISVQAGIICAKKPAGWAQVISASVSNPAGTATTATANCPAGTQVIGGGSTASNHNKDVTIGLTTSLTGSVGWHSTENNNGSTRDSITEWADCADT
jgi:hypothetical protein